MRRTKIRFNLGRGDNYMKWKVERPGHRAIYLDPETVQLVMTGVTLKNRKSSAVKIFKGEHKTVCAWVLCDELDINTKFMKDSDYQDANKVSYNPRVAPHWIYSGSDADNKNLHRLTSYGKHLYT